MDIPLRWRRCLKLRKCCELLSVRRNVVAQISGEVVKLLIGPHARLALHARVSRRCIHSP